MLSTVDGRCWFVVCGVWYCGLLFEWLMMADDGLENFAPKTNYDTHLSTNNAANNPLGAKPAP
jgi:hypothetical protein